jgi:hypothetical protein
MAGTLGQWAVAELSESFRRLSAATATNTPSKQRVRRATKAFQVCQLIARSFRNSQLGE